MPTRNLPGALRALRDPWLAISVAGLCALLALVAAFGADAGVTWDESFQLEYGQRILAWYRSGFRDRSALQYLDLYLYGGLFDASAQWVVEHSPLGPFETKHLLTALVAVLGIAGAWQLAAAAGGRRAGVFAAATLALTPTYIGHGLFNPKDIPFATAAVFTTVTAQRLALGPLPFRWRDIAWAGVALGAALAVRPGGVFLLSYPLAAVLARLGLEIVRVRRAGRAASIVSLAARNLPRIVVGLPIAWLVMLSAWPWAQLEPLSRPIEAIWAASRFNLLGDTLFEGRFVASTQLPARYLLVWFGITLPELYPIAFAAGLAALTLHGFERGQAPRATAPAADGSQALTPAERALLGGGLLALSIALPLAAALLTRPVLYDGHRHFLFLFPPLAALAGWGISSFLGVSRVYRSVRASVIVAYCVSALLVAIEIVELHPYEYVYFNRSVGGLPGAVGRFETDYWGASYREGLAWVVDHVRPHGEPHRLAACDGSSAARMSYYLRRWPKAAGRFSVVETPSQADLVLAVTRLDCNRRVRGRMLHVVTRQGAPLLYVLQRTP